MRFCSIKFGLVLAVCSVCAGFATPALAEVGYYTLGHADIRPYYENGQLGLRYELSSGAIVNGQEADPITNSPVSFSPTSLVVSIADAPLASPDSRFDFTGAAVGDNLWIIPEGQPEAESLGLPWLGFSTEEFEQDDTWIGNQFQVNLIDKTGPGDVSMFFSPEDEFAAPQVHFATLDGIDGNDSYKQYGSTDVGLSVGSHTHVNWAFSQPGIYELTLKFSGEHATDGYQEAIGTFTFQVAAVPEPSSLVSGAAGLCAVVGLGFRRVSRVRKRRCDALR